MASVAAFFRRTFPPFLLNNEVYIHACVSSDDSTCSSCSMQNAGYNLMAKAWGTRPLGFLVTKWKMDVVSIRLWWIDCRPGSFVITHTQVDFLLRIHIALNVRLIFFWLQCRVVITLPGKNGSRHFLKDCFCGWIPSGPASSWRTWRHKCLNEEVFQVSILHSLLVWPSISQRLIFPTWIRICQWFYLNHRSGYSTSEMQTNMISLYFIHVLQSCTRWIAHAHAARCAGVLRWVALDEYVPCFLLLLFF